MREHLEREISRLKRQVGSLAAAVENAVAQAVQAAGEGNSELAAAVRRTKRSRWTRRSTG